MKVFEDYLSELITDMVEICLEYIEDKADKIYILCGNEENIISGSYFFKIHDKVVKKHKVNDVLLENESRIDASIDRMQQVNEIIINDVKALTKRCKEFNRDIPTQMKIVYEVNTHKLDTDISYDLKYTNTKNKGWLDTFEEWFDEIKTQEDVV
ncbi:MAG: hypothetical protein K6G88_13575 [Lachnospiraceae bacterium]|nr:hypothetical protein [Lachnospiraceae bacterium]